MKLRSPIFCRHESAGARVLDWGGWRGPAVFTSLEDEVKSVRTGVAVAEYPFLSHQIVEGPDALATLQRLCTRNLAACPPGFARYTLMLNDEGHPVDDGIVLCLEHDRFIVTVPGLKPTLRPPTAGFFDLKRPKTWLRPESGARVAIHDLGAFTVAVQGPRSSEMLRSVVDFDRFPPWAVCETKVGEVPVLCTRTGFSGERGVEFLVWPECALDLWDTLADLGRSYGLVPFGIDATMVLGFEKGFLNAGDFYPGCTPIELGLDWIVAFDKPSFIGRDAVLQRRREGGRTRLVGVEVAPDAPLPKKDQPIMVDGGAIVGRITNAAFCPTLGTGAARGWLPVEFATPGTRVVVGEGDRACAARVARGYRWYDPAGMRTR